MTYFVNAAVKRSGNGTKEYPFKTISEAASIAVAGDEVLVYPGVYREYIDPANAGTPDARITYRSVEPRGAIITGAEQIKNWKHYDKDVWVARIPNGVFNAYNPYTTPIYGDWFNRRFENMHTGQVFLNGKALYEAPTLEDVIEAKEDPHTWDRPFSVHKWYTTQDEASGETVIYAGFGVDPNKENVEITVRRNCFYPSKTGVGYITLSGFVVKQAATNWAPPTAYQEGMIGPHWSKGWIIEDCEVSHSRCSGISLGKCKHEGNDNKWSNWKLKDGTQNERDVICQAYNEGWTKENIGSHIVRRCEIHDCGQTGIVGHLGGVFSIIEDNHIHHINFMRDLSGAEIGGIKMHAAIDVIIRRNHFHHCTRGLWLDWQAQGTRVTQNLFHDNVIPKELDPASYATGTEDIFIEVSHGPTLVDNNILLSQYALKLATQGVALVHNLIAGGITSVGRGVNNGAEKKPSPRYTPYHVKHRTEIAGFMSILHGDCKFYNNIFVQLPVHPKFEQIMEGAKFSDWGDGNWIVGTIPYENYPTEAEWLAQFDPSTLNTDRYYNPLPVWAGGNVYFGGAKPMSKETDAIVDNEHEIKLELTEKDGKYILETNIYELLPEITSKMISTEVLGMAFEPEQLYEDPNGNPIVFNTDYSGQYRAINPKVGPIENGSDKIVVSKV